MLSSLLFSSFTASLAAITLLPRSSCTTCPACFQASTPAGESAIPTPSCPLLQICWSLPARSTAPIPGHSSRSLPERHVSCQHAASPPRWPTEASAASRSSSLFSPRTFSVNKIICGRSLRRLARFWLSFLDRVEFLSPIPWLRGREGRRALWGICAGHQVLRRQPLRIACARMPLSWSAAEPRAKTHWPARSPLGGKPRGALSGKTRHSLKT